MIEATVTAVEHRFRLTSIYHVYRVSVRFGTDSTATFVVTMEEPPCIGDTWLMTEPRLAELTHRPHDVPDGRSETRAPESVA